MKKELSPGAIAAIAAAAIVVVGGLGWAFMNKATGGQANEAELEQRAIKQSKSEYARYQKSDGTTPSGPPMSNEGEAQAAHPNGK